MVLLFVVFLSITALGKFSLSVNLCCHGVDDVSIGM